MSKIQSIPLQQLRLSPRNVRKTGSADVSDLAASIHAEGLLQNLVVTKADDGHFEVEDGGRRLLALNELERTNRLPSDRIPCIIVDVEQGLEAGLTANIIRQAMHPADEFAAFSKLVEDGKSTSEIAERFGKTERYIQQRLKLANVAPEFFAMYRDGDEGMTLDHLAALAGVDDHEAQRAAWDSIPSYSRTPARLRDYLARGKVSGNTTVAKFVGIDDYVAAGGTIDRDLFSETVYFLDAELLDKVAMAKLDQIAARHIADGWSWAHAQIQMNWKDRDTYGFHPREDDCKEHFASPADEARHNAIAGELEQIEEARDNEENSRYTLEELEAKEDALREEAVSIEERMVKVYSRKVMEESGVLIYLDNHGVEIEYARLKPGESTHGKSTSSRASTAAGDDKKPARKPEISESLRTTLSAHRSEAARARIWADPNLAFALLLQRLLEDCNRNSYAQNGVCIRMSSPQDATKVADIHDALRSRAAEALQLIKDTIKKKPKLEDLVALDHSAKLRLLAALVSHSFDGITGNESGHSGVAAIHALTGFDMVQHWTPATDDFLNRLHGDLVEAAVTEAKGKAVAQQLDGLKKAQRTALAAKLLAGTGWLPKLLRGPGYGEQATKVATPAKDKSPSKKKAKAPKVAKKPSAKKAAKKK